MKYDSNGLEFNNVNEKIIATEIIYPIVISVRKTLDATYNTYYGPNKNYTGLCDLAVELLMKKLNEYSKENNIHVDVYSYHGEQKHSTEIPSSKWSIQHTWALVCIGNEQLYVDPTSSQFKDMYTFIPDFYISSIEPRWYYPDEKNPAWRNKFTRFINKHIKISVKYNMKGEYFKTKEGIIEYYQYEIHGKISDKIYYKRKNRINKSIIKKNK